VEVKNGRLKPASSYDDETRAPATGGLRFTKRIASNARADDTPSATIDLGAPRVYNPISEVVRHQTES